MRFFKFLLPVLIIVAGFSGYSWLKESKEEAEPLQTKNRAPIVSGQVVEIISASPTVRVFGQVETPSSSVLTAGLEADVVRVNVLEGNAVIRDQTLIVLDDTDARLEISQRQSELSEVEALVESDKLKLKADREALQMEKSLLDLSRRAVSRASKLVNTQSGSEATLDEALQNEQRQLLALSARRQAINDFDSRQLQLQARWNKANAALQRAQRDQQRSIVTAPFSGRVTSVMVSAGDRASRSTQLLQIYDDSQLELRAQIPSFYIPSLQQSLDRGESIYARSQILGKSLQLKLHRLSASVSDGQGGVDGFFRSEDDLPSLGVTLELELELPALANVVRVSADSMYNQNTVYLIEEQKLKAIRVNRVGQQVSSSGEQWILLEQQGLDAGSIILNSRLPQAVNGLAVKLAQ